LLDAGATTTDVPAELALRNAVHSCDGGLVTLLLSRGVSPNANHYLGGSVLMDAVERGDLDIVSLLLDSGADPNQLGKYKGWVQPVLGEGSALMLCAKAGRADLARMLLDHGADPSIVDVYGYTAQRVAEENGHDEVLDLIRSRTAGDHGP
jgi:ankyrin repeat protein